MGQVVRLPVEGPGPQAERPVSRLLAARKLGVSTRTLDRWIVRGMPEDVPGEQHGCWFRVGAHRRFYVERIRAWGR